MTASLRAATTSGECSRPPARPPRLDSLSGIRPVASFLVFATHANGLLGGAVSSLVGATVGAGGFYAVTFFFVLSGFVLTWTHRPDDTAGGFWRRRFARIYPVYLVAFVLGLLVSTFVQQHGLARGPAVASLFLVQSWSTDPHVYYAGNGVAWALSCEAFFYLLFPFVIGPLVRLDRPGRRAAQVALLAGVFALATVASLIDLHWLSEEFPVAALLSSLLGCTVAVDVARDEMLGSVVGLRAALALNVVVLSGINALPIAAFGAAALPIVPFLLLLMALARRDISGRSSAFASHFMVRAASLSFCFYLTHQLVIKTLRVVLGHLPQLPGQGLVQLTAAFVIAVGVARFLHTRLERPAEGWLRGRSTHTAPGTVAG